MTLVQDNSVQAINTALLSVKRDISILTAAKSTCEPSGNPSSGSTDETTAGLEPGKTYNINISGNAATATKATTATTAETATTATLVANALTVNGKTYNGSEAVDAGVQTVVNGGTGVTTQADINKAFIGNLDVGISDVTDGTEFVSSYASDNGFSEPGYVNTPLKRKFSAVWGYIKGKISSVLGLTASNYGGKASTAETADKLKSTQIPKGANLNNYRTPGFYHAIDNTNYANAPITNFTLQVIQLMGSYTFQVIYAYGSGLIYTRSFIYQGGHMEWTRWAKTVMQVV